jgi:uncharacterized membrane protein YccC
MCNFSNYIKEKMTIKAKENYLGAWAFLLGVILAVIIGVASSFINIETVKDFSPKIYGILVLLGLLVGLTINVSRKDAQTFLYTGTIIVIISSFGKASAQGSLIGIGIDSIVSTTFGALLSLFATATIIVALKTLFSITRI